MSRNSNGNVSEPAEFTNAFASGMEKYIQSCVKKAVRQETLNLHAEIEDLKATVNALEVELKCARRENGIPPKGELFKSNVVKYIKLEDDEVEPNLQDADESYLDEGDEEEKIEDEEEYDPGPQTSTKKRTRNSISSQYQKYKRWRARVDDVIFDEKKIGSFVYDHGGKKYDLSAMVHEKAPANFTNTSITSAAKDVTKYFLSVIIGDGYLHLYTSSARTRRSYEPIPVRLQTAIKDLIFSGAVSYSGFDVDELKKCITNAVETAIYDKCSYARKHPEKRARLEKE